MPFTGIAELEHIPKFTYTDCDVETTFTLRVPQAAWNYWSAYQGGSDESASGVMEAFVYRDDRGLEIMPRFTEEEWVEDVEPFLKTVLSDGQAFTVQTDASDAGTIETYRLVEPRAGGARVVPERLEYSGLLMLRLVLRVDDGSVPPYPYFPSLA